MRNKLTDELAVCGMNAVLAIGEYNPETINRLFLREDRLQSFTGVCKQLAERKRPYKICEDDELERICKSIRHQGVVAMIEEPVIEYLTMEDLDLWAAEGKAGIILHDIGNDHNLGAIARAAAFFDVSFIILNEKGIICTDDHRDDYKQELRLTTSAYRIAEGGFEHLTVRKISNTAAFLKDASKKLVTIGTDTMARRRISDLKNVVKSSRLAAASSSVAADDQTDGKAKRPGIALVLGNEERGLPENVKEQCSCLLRIPGTGNIQSLNVSQAAALFLHTIFEV
ncbi:MAG: RNA methyltransferase [Treponema sp.]|nr:RNA methyltransferase [Treponema sp.]